MRHLVVTIDNLPRQKVPAAKRPTVSSGGPFLAQGDELHATLDPKNYARYEPMVNAVRKLDMQRVADVYLRFYPLFQSAYQDLGYPNGYFNDRLVAVIDSLLAAPEPSGPIELTAAERHVHVRGSDARGVARGAEVADSHGPGQCGRDQVEAQGAARDRHRRTARRGLAGRRARSRPSTDRSDGKQTKGDDNEQHGRGSRGAARPGQTGSESMAGHRRLVARHRVRVVRLLFVRAAGRASSARSSSPGVNEVTGFIFALAAFAAGFAVRPFGALVFGRLGDLVGRKHTFLITMSIMGGATFLVGLLPSYASAGRGGSDRARGAAAAAGPRAGRRIRRRRDLRRRACAARKARPVHELDSNHRDARIVRGAAGRDRHPDRHGGGCLQGLGMAHSVPDLPACC